jgi:hypothetical protein
MISDHKQRFLEQGCRVIESMRKLMEEILRTTVLRH